VRNDDPGQQVARDRGVEVDTSERDADAAQAREIELAVGGRLLHARVATQRDQGRHLSLVESWPNSRRRRRLLPAAPRGDASRVPPSSPWTSSARFAAIEAQ